MTHPLIVMIIFLVFCQVSITLDAYLEGRAWSAIAKDSYPLIKAGREVDMLTEQCGVVRSLQGERFLRALPSFRSLHWEVQPGQWIPKTIDCFTRPGCVQLVSDTEEDADRDFEAIHSLDKVGGIYLLLL